MCLTQSGRAGRNGLASNQRIAPPTRRRQFTNWIVELRARRKHRAAGLQIAPLQQTMDTVENENHAPLGSLNPHLHSWR